MASKQKPDKKQDTATMLAEIARLRDLMGGLNSDQLLQVIAITSPDRAKESPQNTSLFMTALDTGLSIGLRHPRLANAMLAAMRSSVASGKGDDLASLNVEWDKSDEEWVTLLNACFGITETVS